MKGVRWVAVVSLLLVGQLAVFGGTAAAQTDASGEETCDRAVLEALYDATGDASWTDDTSWKTSAPLDEWRGSRERAASGCGWQAHVKHFPSGNRTGREA